MHSRIFQITTSPIPESDYLSDDYYWDHWFVGSIADYVSGDNDREEDITHLRDRLQDLKTAIFNKDNSFLISPNGKNEYFKSAYSKFIEAVKKASDISLETFSSGVECGPLLYDIKTNYCDKFYWYVCTEDFDTIPLDEFMRSVEPGEKYYIGGVLDYHY